MNYTMMHGLTNLKSRANVCISMYIFGFLIRVSVILTKDHKLKILVHKLKVKINTEY